MKKVLFITLFLLGIVPLLANAASISVDESYWLDSRSTTTGGIAAAAGWDGTGNNGFKISWEITYDTDSSLYTYNYTFSGVGESGLLSKGLSHWILEVTNPALKSDFSSVDPAFTNDSPKLWESPHPGNPDIPGDIYGIKWDVSGSGETYTVSFKTESDPVWGDFYAKDGTTEKQKVDVVAWNSGFGIDPTATTTNFTDWIATPDGGAVPIPAAVWLFGSGLVVVAGVVRRKK